MIFDTPTISNTFMQVLEFLGTFTFAISGIRQAAHKNFDWFGGFVCGVVVAIGGGTVRDLMLGVTPFWMTNALYITSAFLAQLCVILFSRYLKYLKNTWFVFDTIGLALFTIVGIQKTLLCGYPFWVAVVMGCITGSAGGILRDVLLDTVPVLLRKDFYAMTCIVGGLFYWLLYVFGVHTAVTSILTFLLICLLRFLAIRYHLRLPTLRNDDGEQE